MRKFATLLALLLTTTLAVRAQEAEKATLVADGVEIQSDSVLVASGHVEIFFKGQRLSAARVVYDRAADRLLITGPIRIDDGKGTVVLADQASLKADMTEGLIQSARVVLDQQLQLAAADMQRVGGRYTALRRVAASSCKICEGGDTPLWELRASRVVHDQQERQLYFSDAQFRLGGVPVFYIPRLRMPDPSLSRTSGILMPKLTNSSKIGTGLWLPYFLTLGDSRDVLITPFLSTGSTRAAHLRYRQEFQTGSLEITAQGARDAIRPGDLRGYLTADGRFDLSRGYELTFHGALASDDGYLLDYGVSDDDRLISQLEVARTRRDEYISARLIGVQTLRVGEDGSTIPSVITDATWARRFNYGPFGGQGGLALDLHSHARTATLSVDSDGDGIADGRDTSRASLKGDWRYDLLLPGGIVGGLMAEGRADFYSIGQDDAVSGADARAWGAVAAELRWPWVKAGANGSGQLIEPVVQLVMAPNGSDSIPNEDSVLVEFDEGNLFALNRYPGADAVERGSRANIGVNYLRYDPNGWTLGITAGRVIRADDLGQFNLASGLSGTQSDWLAAWQVSFPGGMSLTSRTVLDDGLSLTKGEVRLGANGKRYDLSGGYVYVKADPSESRPIRTEELVFDSTIRLTESWNARVSSRYDLVQDRASRLGGNLTFRNECILVDLSLSRRFTSSSSVTPTTEYGLSVQLLGFGGGASTGAARQCRG
jgi:LPS-assembly protein